MKNLLIVLASAFLIISGSEDLTARSQGASSWANETSFAALTIRSIGGLKVGIGILALSFIKLSGAKTIQKEAHEDGETNSKLTEEERFKRYVEERKNANN